MENIHTDVRGGRIKVANNVLPHKILMTNSAVGNAIFLPPFWSIAGSLSRL